MRPPGAAAWSEEAYRGRALDEDGYQSAACRLIALELNARWSQSAALMSNPPPGPATHRREVWAYPLLPALRVQRIASAEWDPA
eukprot:scaffold65258_cov36-Phaeocystis_antarctica.AAC.1